MSITCLRATHRQAQRLGKSGRFEIGSKCMRNIIFHSLLKNSVNPKFAKVEDALDLRRQG